MIEREREREKVGGVITSTWGNIVRFPGSIVDVSLCLWLLLCLIDYDYSQGCPRNTQQQFIIGFQLNVSVGISYLFLRNGKFSEIFQK